MEISRYMITEICWTKGISLNLTDDVDRTSKYYLPREGFKDNDKTSWKDNLKLFK